MSLLYPIVILCGLLLVVVSGYCPESIPAQKFVAQQGGESGGTTYDWYVSLTTPSTDGTCPDHTTSHYVLQEDHSDMIPPQPPITCGFVMTQPLEPPREIEMGCAYSFTNKLEGYQRRTANVTVKCGSGNLTLNGNVLASQIVPGDYSSGYNYAFDMSALVVCAAPDNGGSSSSSGGCGGGCVFLIIFFVGAFLYVVVFIIINYTRGHRGKELAPHPEFWTATFPGLLKDGVRYTGHLITTPCRGSGGSYQEV